MCKSVFQCERKDICYYDVMAKITGINSLAFSSTEQNPKLSQKTQ